jgi:hypothetical protein
VARAVPFPSSIWPAWARPFLDLHARRGLDPALIGGAMLAVLAAAAGAGPRVWLTEAWSERLIQWLLIVGSTGRGKTGAAQVAMAPLVAIHGDRFRAYSEARAAWDLLSEKERKGRRAPAFTSIYTTNMTTEKVARRLLQDPALLIAPDEFAGYLTRLGAYNGRPGSDRAAFLELGTGAPWSFERVTDDHPYVVGEPTVTILSTMTPGQLELLGDADDGTSSRFCCVTRTEAMPFTPLADQDQDQVQAGILSAMAAWDRGIRQLVAQRQHRRSITPTPSAFTALDRARRRAHQLAQDGRASAHVRAWAWKGDRWLSRYLGAAVTADQVQAGTLDDPVPAATPAHVDAAAELWDHYRAERELAWIPDDLSTTPFLARHQGAVTDRIRRALNEDPEGRLTTNTIAIRHLGGVRGWDQAVEAVDRFRAEFPHRVRVERAPNGREVWALYDPERPLPNGRVVVQEAEPPLSEE